MMLYSGIFYALAGVILIATLLSITRRNPVHAVVYLIIAFFGTALLFYLLGAPLLAALEVIIYAGGIMVLFIFIIMTIRLDEWESRPAITHRWILPLVLAVISLTVGAVLIVADPHTGAKLPAAMASPKEFGRLLFDRYWLPVEIASYLLFVGLVGAYYLGKQDRPSQPPRSEETP